MSSSPMDRIIAASADYLAEGARALGVSWPPRQIMELVEGSAEMVVSTGGPSGLRKVMLLDLDRGGGVTAQYNPKELKVERGANWSASENAKGNTPELSFTGATSRTLTLELFFDTYESDDPLDVRETFIKKLEWLTMVVNPKGMEDERRPPRVMVVWGEQKERFIGVVNSVATTYSMFLPNGRPVRATASVKITEADRLKSPPKAKK